MKIPEKTSCFSEKKVFLCKFSIQKTVFSWSLKFLAVFISMNSTSI